MTNPAVTLRESLRARFPGAMVRWDDSGRALLVTDAPRRGYDALDGCICGGLAYYDLPPEALCAPDAPPFGGYSDNLPELQAALSMLLADGFSAQECAAGLPAEGRALVQTAYAACARGERFICAALPQLRARWAEALRRRDEPLKTACRAAAAVLLAWFTQTRTAPEAAKRPSSEKKQENAGR